MLPEDAESLVSETHDRTIHQNSGRPNRPSAGAYQQACLALDCNVVTVSDKFSLILFDSLFGPLGQLNIPHRRISGTDLLEVRKDVERRAFATERAVEPLALRVVLACFAIYDCVDDLRRAAFQDVAFGRRKGRCLERC